MCTTLCHAQKCVPLWGALQVKGRVDTGTEGREEKESGNKKRKKGEGNALYFKSARNVTVNILNDQTKVLTQLITGPKAVEAYGKKFEVKTVSGKLLFSADDNEVVVGAERLRVLEWDFLF
ncbi:hypothetical protein P7K49_003474 [Saguinus oedipus]|uniref:Uncharacterized protein n=1 Tax=Saguinus oedipus TaxID=9490 RepID=A0ABQ9W743_SAGOE|nr:hypothetical protein P7K49_003474 [Saguinus oedipus]